MRRKRETRCKLHCYSSTARIPLINYANLFLQWLSKLPTDNYIPSRGGNKKLPQTAPTLRNDCFMGEVFPPSSFNLLREKRSTVIAYIKHKIIMKLNIPSAIRPTHETTKLIFPELISLRARRENRFCDEWFAMFMMFLSAVNTSKHN